MRDRAIVTLTKGGVQLGRKLQKLLDNTNLYVPDKFYEECDNDNVYPYYESVKELTGRLFLQYRALIFIMATGIVVRSIAPLIIDKQTDPAIVVMDELGINAISLLSGHLGGANELSLLIANELATNAVITTASDITETIAVDTLALKLNCIIENFADATKITAHIVNKEKIGIISTIPLNIKLPDNIIMIEKINEKLEDLKGLIIISERTDNRKVPCDSVILRPKNIILGIGCREGKTKEEILNSIKDVLNSSNISLKSVKHFATIDIKEKELGIQEAAHAVGVPLVIIKKDDILAIEKDFSISEFVKKSVGVGAVCEPAAMLSSQNGKVIVRRRKYSGITLAIVKEGVI